MQAGYPRADRLIVAENRWLAARHGLRAPMVHGGDAPVSARALVSSLLDRVAEDAAALAGDWALAQVADLLERGSSAERQLRSYRRSRDLELVLGEVADETASV